MNDSLGTFVLDDRSTFIANSRLAADQPEMSDAEITTFVAERWAEMFEAKRVENDRLNRLDLYYMGRHYRDAALNRAQPVTNYCFSTVETLHPVLTKTMPRPEPQPREYRSKARVDQIAAYAQFKMDQVAWERPFRIGVRDFLKFGWNANIVTFDPATGLSMPSYLSPYHLYPDANSRTESEMEMFAIAMPVQTRRLRALFPDSAAEIQPDNIAAPDYEVQRARIEMMDGYVVNPPLLASSALTFVREGSPPPTTTTALVAGDGTRIQYGQTTFLVQLFVRDHSKISVRYGGTRYAQHPEFGTIEVPHSIMRDEPCCESGWRVFSITAGGTILQRGVPLDVAYGGIPIVIGRNYAQGDWFYAFGEIDQIIPIQRDINKRDALIAQALELSANPPIKAFNNSGLARNTRYVQGGDVVWLNQGYDIDYFDYRGPSEKQFEYRMLRSRDIDTVSGVHDVQQGQRPAGIEAASAIRYLQEAAAARAVAKTPELLYSYTTLLKKCLIWDGYKANPRISVYGSGGQPIALSREDLLYDYDIRWAEGSGTEVARREMEDKVLSLFQLGLVDAEYAIGSLDLKGKDELLARLREREAIEMRTRLIDAQTGAAGDGGTSRPGRNGGSRRPQMQEAGR